MLKHRREEEARIAADEEDDDSDPEPMSAENTARFDIPEHYITHADAFYKRVWTLTIDSMAADFKSI